jgi:hypothetical protein
MHEPQIPLPPERKRNSSVTRRWPWPRRLLVAGLLCGFSSQVIWYSRDALLMQPVLKNWVDYSFHKLNLEPPASRRAEPLQILRHQLHHEEGSIYVYGQIANAANVELVAPRLQLLMLNQQGQVFSQRSLKPSEYFLGDQTRINPRTTNLFQFVIAAPDVRVWGYELRINPN